jgi:hypothetical protein
LTWSLLSRTFSSVSRTTSSERRSYTSTKNEKRGEIRKMAKYVYLTYFTTDPELNLEMYMTKIRPKLENENVKLIADGRPFGVLESGLLIHSTDLALAEFIDFRREAFSVDGKHMIAQARTIVMIPY